MYNRITRRKNDKYNVASMMMGYFSLRCMKRPLRAINRHLRWLHRVIIYGVARASVIVLNAVFAFAFTLSPLKLITCNKQ